MDRQLVVRPTHRTPLAAVVAAGVVVLASAAGRAESLPITTILPFDYGVTGIRADDGNEVVVTGGTGLPNLSQGLPAFVYRGPLDGMASATTTGDPRLHLFMPVFGGTTAYGAQFYGPNTHRFNPSSIAAGSIRAVGAYLENGPADFQKGMIYDGPLDGSARQRHSHDRRHRDRRQGDGDLRRDRRDPLLRHGRTRDRPRLVRIGRRARVGDARRPRAPDGPSARIGTLTPTPLPDPSAPALPLTLVC